MHNYDSIAAAYINTFNTTASEQCAEAVATLFASDATYVDPMAEVSGHEGIAAFIAGAHAQFPGWVFSQIGTVDGHHNQARFTWGLGPEGEEPPVVGFDVITLNADGVITAVYGFLDKVPAA